MARFAVGLMQVLLAIYRRSIGLMLPTACRHYPSCSAYAEQAIKTHGIVAGARMAAYRVLRCHPFCEGGYDPVPTSKG